MGILFNTKNKKGNDNVSVNTNVHSNA